MENFTLESRYLKLCNEFRAFIRFMNAAIYRPVYQKLLMCPLIKRLGRNSSFMTKTSRRAIMHRSRLKNIYIRKRSDKNWKNYKKERSSNANEVIRAVLNSLSFFFTKRFRAQKNPQKHVTSQNQLTKRIKTFKRMKTVCFAFLYFLCARRKENRKKRKVPTMYMY